MAPQRVMGPFVDAEISTFIEILQLPFRVGEASADDADAAAAVDADTPRAGAPPSFLAVIGGGGFDGASGEETLARKLELLLGVSQLVRHEKGGFQVALGGELACYVLSALLGITLGSSKISTSAAIVALLKETLLEVPGLGVTILLPMDLVCEDQGPQQPPDSGDAPQPGADGAADSAPASSGEQTFPLVSAFQRLAEHPVSLGIAPSGDGELFLWVQPETGLLKLEVASFRDAEEAAASGTPEVVPEGWIVRDLGEQALEGLSRALRRARGVLWNGALGAWEEERWQKGTRAFLATVENRLNPPEEEEDEEEDEEDEDEDAAGEADASKEKIEPDVEFEVAIVIGRDSTRMLPSLMESPSLMSFVSQSGEALLQLLRGRALPGLLACSEKRG